MSNKKKKHENMYIINLLFLIYFSLFYFNAYFLYIYFKCNHLFIYFLYLLNIVIILPGVDIWNKITNLILFYLCTVFHFYRGPGVLCSCEISYYSLILDVWGMLSSIIMRHVNKRFWNSYITKDWKWIERTSWIYSIYAKYQRIKNRIILCYIHTRDGKTY